MVLLVLERFLFGLRSSPKKKASNNEASEPERERERERGGGAPGARGVGSAHSSSPEQSNPKRERARERDTSMGGQLPTIALAKERHTCLVLHSTAETQ